MSTFKTTGARLLLTNVCCNVNLLNPNIHIQYRLTQMSIYFLLNYLENFFKDQSISPLVIILFILITISLGDINKDIDMKN